MLAWVQCGNNPENNNSESNHSTVIY